MHLLHTPVMHTFSHMLVKTHTVCCMEMLPVPELWLFICNRAPQRRVNEFKETLRLFGGNHYHYYYYLAYRAAHEAKTG